MKITKENATVENLSELNYGDLKENFENLGVESAWKPGTKAKTMIKNALSKLDIIKKMDTSEKTKEEVDTEVEEIEVIQAELVSVKEEEAKVVAKKKDEAVVKAIKGPNKRTKADIETMIGKLQRALVNVIPSHRVGTVKRLETFEKMLADEDYI
jgi:hypothetical protein